MREEPTGFPEWWSLWMKTKRHTDGRGKCRKEYARQIADGATDEDLYLAAQYHIRNTKDLAFIPLAASWLNSEAWVDEAPKERALLARNIERQNVVQMTFPTSKWKQEFERKRMESE